MENSKIIGDRNNTIGKNIRRIRIENNIGQTELVQRLQLNDVEITREALVKIESGKQHIKLEQLREIKHLLNTSYEDLLE